MKNKIIEIISAHVDDFAFVSVEEYKTIRSSLQKEDLYSDYSSFEGYKTIITLALSYPSTQLKWGGKGNGLLSQYSYGMDYHLVFRQRLAQIETKLQGLGLTTLGSVDTGFVDERFASYLANLGFLGKNQFLIHPVYGGYIYLATILIDYAIDKEVKLLDTCGSCTKCIDACPSNALDNGFDISTCISETSQSKRVLTEKEMSYMKTMVYGCDICQKVCPKNKGINVSHNREFLPTGIERVDLLNLLTMSNKEYMNIYKNNASSWKGGTVIKRNALCLLANQGVKEAIPLIEETLQKYQDIVWYNNVAQKALKILERK